MKYLIFIVPFLLSSCSSIRWITVEKGQAITENREPVTILGNPQLSCFNWKNELIAEGYFVRQTENGSFLVDEFGKDFVLVTDPNCRLGNGK
jgi:hypothetical protein